MPTEFGDDRSKDNDFSVSENQRIRPSSDITPLVDLNRLKWRNPKIVNTRPISERGTSSERAGPWLIAAANGSEIGPSVSPGEEKNGRKNEFSRQKSLTARISKSLH